MATALVSDESDSSSKGHQFHHYDFQKDAQFMEGWEKISQSYKDKVVPLESRMLTAKLFYYSRFVEPITLDEYQSWLAEFNKDGEAKAPGQFARSPEATTAPEAQNGELGTNLEEGTRSPEKKLPDQEKALVDNIELVASAESSTESCKLQNSAATAGETGTEIGSQMEDPKYPSSFLEVMQRVQEGLDIPGVEELHIEATNEPPTEPAATRVKKPWDA